MNLQITQQAELKIMWKLISIIIWLRAGFYRNAHGHYESDVNAQLGKQQDRKCESTFYSKSSNDLKLNENRQFLLKVFTFSCALQFFCV